MCNNMDEPQDNYAERSQTKKKKKKNNMLSVSIYKILENAN